MKSFTFCQACHGLDALELNSVKNVWDFDSLFGDGDRHHVPLVRDIK
jgi:hypothetical protein